MSLNSFMGSEAPPEGRVLTQIREHLLLIVIDRPRKLNAFSPEMLMQLRQEHGRIGRKRWLSVRRILANVSVTQTVAQRGSRLTVP